MTIEEAKKVAEIIEEADGGCSVCVGSLLLAAHEHFPEYDGVWMSRKLWPGLEE